MVVVGLSTYKSGKKKRGSTSIPASFCNTPMDGYTYTKPRYDRRPDRRPEAAWRLVAKITSLLRFDQRILDHNMVRFSERQFGFIAVRLIPIYVASQIIDRLGKRLI